MSAKLLMPLIFLAALGCAGQGPRARQARALGPAAAAPAAGRLPAEREPGASRDQAKAAEAPPRETLAQADLAYESRLAASRGQFETERQIAVLQQAVLLYTQFLQRADGRPELEPALRKSRERIEDANATIDFLRASLPRAGGASQTEGDPPKANTE